jgi:hypothetical protein
LAEVDIEKERREHEETLIRGSIEAVERFTVNVGELYINPLFNITINQTAVTNVANTYTSTTHINSITNVVDESVHHQLAVISARLAVLETPTKSMAILSYNGLLPTIWSSFHTVDIHARRMELYEALPFIGAPNAIGWTKSDVPADLSPLKDSLQNMWHETAQVQVLAELPVTVHKAKYWADPSVVTRLGASAGSEPSSADFHPEFYLSQHVDVSITAMSADATEVKASDGPMSTTYKVFSAIGEASIIGLKMITAVMLPEILPILGAATAIASTIPIVGESIAQVATDSVSALSAEVNAATVQVMLSKLRSLMHSVPGTEHLLVENRRFVDSGGNGRHHFRSNGYATTGVHAGGKMQTPVTTGDVNVKTNGRSEPDSVYPLPGGWTSVATNVGWSDETRVADGTWPLPNVWTKYRMGQDYMTTTLDNTVFKDRFNGGAAITHSIELNRTLTVAGSSTSDWKSASPLGWMIAKKYGEGDAICIGGRLAFVYQYGSNLWMHGDANGNWVF